MSYIDDGLILNLNIYKDNEKILKMRQQRSGDIIEISTKNVRFRKEIHDDDAVGDYFFLWVDEIVKYRSFVKLYNDIIGMIMTLTSAMLQEDDVKIYHRNKNVIIKTWWAKLVLRNMNPPEEEIDKDDIMNFLENEKIKNEPRNKTKEERLQ